MPRELSDAALRAKFRHLLWEVGGFDCFQVIGWRGQKSMVFRHVEGEAHKKLLDNLLRDTVYDLDVEEAEGWVDSGSCED